MRGASGLWRVRFAVPRAAAAGFAEAIEPLCLAVSWTEPEGNGAAAVEGLCDRPPDPAVLACLLAAAAREHGVAAPGTDVVWLAARDWLALNRRAFPALRIGRFVVHGAHARVSVPAGGIEIRLDAATAFGSGEHATTRGCLLALGALARRRPLGRVLDLGCGSGILAIAAAKLGARRGVACDIDAVAVRVATGNVRVNRAAGRVATALGPGFHPPAVRRNRPYDLILANVLAEPLLRLAPALAGYLAEDGAAVLSGFLERDALPLAVAFRGHGLALRSSLAIDGWRTLVLGRRRAVVGATGIEPVTSRV